MKKQSTELIGCGGGEGQRRGEEKTQDSFVPLRARVPGWEMAPPRRDDGRLKKEQVWRIKIQRGHAKLHLG